MSKIKLFTHGADLDGVGCAILAYLAFGRENVDVEYCDYKDIAEKIRVFWEDGNDYKYNTVYITDISISEDLAKRIETHPGVQKWRLFDHHATALGLNKYGWCEVRVNDNQMNIKASGTSIFFDYLASCDCFKDCNRNKLMNIIRFVEIVRNYDTWRWKELGEERLVCKQVNDLLDIYGREEFIDWAIHGIRGDFCPSPIVNVFPLFSGIDYAVLAQRQKDIDIYIEQKDKQLQVAKDLFGNDFGYVFAERYFSELGNRLCELHPEIEYVAMIDISKGVVSFRSVREDIDLGGEIAHSLGGGGHKKAAGSRFNAGEIGKLVSWSVLNVKPTWSDIMPQYLGEPVKKED